MDNDHSSKNSIYRGDMTMLLIRTNNGGRKYTKGFSLVELIIVIAIIAIWVSIAVPS